MSDKRPSHFFNDNLRRRDDNWLSLVMDPKTISDIVHQRPHDLTNNRFFLDFADVMIYEEDFSGSTNFRSNDSGNRYSEFVDFMYKINNTRPYPAILYRPR